MQHGQPKPAKGPRVPDQASIESAVLHTLPYAALALIAVQYLAEASFFAGLGFDTVVSLIIPLLLIGLAGRRPREFGFQLGDWRAGLKYAAVILLAITPALVYFSTQSEFTQYYPIWPAAAESWRFFAIYHLFIVARVFLNESLFRALLLFSLPEKHANLAQALVYTLVHVGKPLLELPYSFALGYAIGWANLRTKSILPSFLVHYLSNVIFDMLVFGDRLVGS